MRALFSEVVDAQSWREVIRVALSRAMAGDSDSRRWLSDWVVGKVPDEVKADLNVQGKLRIVIEE